MTKDEAVSVLANEMDTAILYLERDILPTLPENKERELRWSLVHYKRAMENVEKRGVKVLRSLERSIKQPVSNEACLQLLERLIWDDLYAAKNPSLPIDVGLAFTTIRDHIKQSNQ